jgi:NitT/TauT family transport system substrate-binding protein
VFEPLVARGNGLDLMFVAASARIRSTPPDNSALLVLADGPVRGAADLEGRRVSAGLLHSVNHIHLLEWLERRGVNTARVQFLEVPFPQMADALFQGRLDAVWNVEPFVSVMISGGKVRALAYPYQDNIPGMDITAYVAKASWIKAHPDTMRRFRRAIDRATVFLVDAPKEERDRWIAAFSGMKPERVASINLPVFTTELNVPSLRTNLELAIRHQMVARSFAIEDMVWKP